METVSLFARSSIAPYNWLSEEMYTRLGSVSTTANETHHTCSGKQYDNGRTNVLLWVLLCLLFPVWLLARGIKNTH